VLSGIVGDFLYSSILNGKKAKYS
jgi:hypothetical protein